MRSETERFCHIDGCAGDLVNALEDAGRVVICGGSRPGSVPGRLTDQNGKPLNLADERMSASCGVVGAFARKHSLLDRTRMATRRHLLANKSDGFDKS